MSAHYAIWRAHWVLAGRARERSERSMSAPNGALSAPNGALSAHSGRWPDPPTVGYHTPVVVCRGCGGGGGICHIPRGPENGESAMVVGGRGEGCSGYFGITGGGGG